jgi:hypothetical protein
MKFSSQDIFELDNVRYYLLNAVTIHLLEDLSKKFSVDQLFMLSLKDKGQVELILKKSLFFLADNGMSYQYFHDRRTSPKSNLVAFIQEIMALESSVAINHPQLTFIQDIRVTLWGDHYCSIFNLVDEPHSSWQSFNHLLNFLTGLGLRGIIKIDLQAPVALKQHNELIFRNPKQTVFKNFLSFTKF